jgi:hypothetical protein
MESEMHPIEMVYVRRRLGQARAADEVAQWFIQLLLVPSVPKGEPSVFLEFIEPTIPDTAFSVEVHRKKFAGVQSHAMMGETLVGLIELCPIGRDGVVGESIFEIRAMDGRVVFPNGTCIEQHFLGQEQYDPVRLQTSALILAAVQNSLPKIPVT